MENPAQPTDRPAQKGIDPLPLAALGVGWSFESVLGGCCRNTGQARRRVLRSDHTEEQLHLDPITLEDGTMLHVHPGNKDSPVPASRAHALLPPLGVVESSSDSEDGPSRFGS